MKTLPSSVMSFTETEMEAAIACAKHRLVIVAPGMSIKIARALATKWHELGSAAVQVIVDLDPEVCRLGYGEADALELLQQTVQVLGTQLQQQAGLRIGLVMSDETTTVFAPTPLLIEAGGEPGERFSAIRLGTSLLDADPETGESSVSSLNLAPASVLTNEVEKTCEKLLANPPLKFDVAQKINVFNAKFEFVEFEMRGLAIAQKKVAIPSDLLGLGRDPGIQKLLQSTFRLIEDQSELSGDRVSKLKQFIVKKYLTVLPNYGVVVLRPHKPLFERALRTLDRYILRFKRNVEASLQSTMDANADKLFWALLPSVTANQPKRWPNPSRERLAQKEVEFYLRRDLKQAFGNADALFKKMTVKAIFKGVTYELLNDPQFMEAAHEAFPLLELLHDEFKAAKAEQLALPKG